MPYYVTYTCDYCDGEYANSRIQDHTNPDSVAEALAEAVRQKEYMTRKDSSGDFVQDWECRKDGTMRCYNCQRRENLKLELG